MGLSESTALSDDTKRGGAMQACRQARSQAGRAIGVSARAVWTRFWDSGGLFEHPRLTGLEG
jgi:hypothetical protein